MANSGSIDRALRKASAASSYSKSWSSAKPRRNASCAAGAPELANETSPRFVCACAENTSMTVMSASRICIRSPYNLSMRVLQCIVPLLLLTSTLTAQIEAPLPPAIPWNGKSRELVVKSDDPWITPAEQSDFRTSPTYDETVAYLRRLTAASPQMRMVSLGKSPEGRDIWMVVASKEQLFMPDALHRTGKPTLFAQGGIHAGEIDGKDAGLMLLRDLRPGGRLNGVLDRVNVLFVPIFNVDGHERTSKFGRINQRGPEVIGWRTNARNMNL